MVDKRPYAFNDAVKVAANSKRNSNMMISTNLIVELNHYIAELEEEKFNLINERFKLINERNEKDEKIAELKGILKDLLNRLVEYRARLVALAV